MSFNTKYIFAQSEIHFLFLKLIVFVHLYLQGNKETVLSLIILFYFFIQALHNTKSISNV